MSLFTYYDESEVETIEPVFYRQKSDETRAKMSEYLKVSRSKVRFTTEHRAKLASHLTEERQRQMRLAKKQLYRFHTPYGVFESSQKAAEAEGISQGSTIRSRCDNKNFPNYFREILDK